MSLDTETLALSKNLGVAFNKLINQSTNNFVDISTEAWREYRFSGGELVKIDGPVALAVSTSGHRLLDASGVSHYVPKGWVHLKWKVKDGQPHFVK